MIERFFKLLIEKFLRIFGDIKIFPFPLFIIYDPRSYAVTAKETRMAEFLLEEGDIVLRFYKNYLDGYFISGSFSHASIATNQKTIIHAIAEGVVEEDILKFCRCDGLTILRPRLSDEIKSKAVDYARKQKGKCYDFEFNSENEDSYFCTELVYWSYKDNLNVIPKKINSLFGLIKKVMIFPDEYIKSDQLDIIFATSLAIPKIKKIQKGIKK